MKTILNETNSSMIVMRPGVTNEEIEDVLSASFAVEENPSIGFVEADRSTDDGEGATYEPTAFRIDDSVVAERIDHTVLRIANGHDQALAKAKEVLSAGTIRLYAVAVGRDDIYPVVVECDLWDKTPVNDVLTGFICQEEEIRQTIVTKYASGLGLRMRHDPAYIFKEEAEAAQRQLA